MYLSLHVTLPWSWQSAGASINRSDCTADPSLVRAVALFGFAFRPKPGQSNCCLCEEVVKLDPKYLFLFLCCASNTDSCRGNIPSFAINLGKKKAAIGLHMLRKEVMQYRWDAAFGIHNLKKSCKTTRRKRKNTNCTGRGAEGKAYTCSSQCVWTDSGSSH